LFRETNIQREERFSHLSVFIKNPLKLAKYSVSLSKQKTPDCQIIQPGFIIKQPCVAFINPLNTAKEQRKQFI
jgi:hypothetical protein